MEKQRVINEEITRAKIHEQRELNTWVEKKIQQEEEWLVRKVQMEKETKEVSSIASGTTEFFTFGKITKNTQ